MIIPSLNKPFVEKTKMLVDTPWVSWVQGATRGVNAILRSGTTVQRPTGRPVSGSDPGVWIGMPYFDTTLGKPIWAKTILAAAPYTVSWVDATGAPV